MPTAAACSGGMYTWVNTHKRGVKLVPLQQRRDAQESSSSILHTIALRSTLIDSFADFASHTRNPPKNKGRPQGRGNQGWGWEWGRGIFPCPSPVFGSSVNPIPLRGQIMPSRIFRPFAGFVPDRDRGDAVVRSRVGGNGQITCVSYT